MWPFLAPFPLPSSVQPLISRVPSSPASYSPCGSPITRSFLWLRLTYQHLGLAAQSPGWACVTQEQSAGQGKAMDKWEQPCPPPPNPHLLQHSPTLHILLLNSGGERNAQGQPSDRKRKMGFSHSEMGALGCLDPLIEKSSGIRVASYLPLRNWCTLTRVSVSHPQIDRMIELRP